MIRKKLALVISVVILLEGFFSFGLSDTYLIYEDSSNKIIDCSNEMESKGIASVTKIMTYLLVMEAIDEGKISMDDTILVTKEMESVPYSYWLKEGDQVKVRELVESLLVISANDSAYALGVTLAGSEESFANRMNEKAKELGLKDSVFFNASGLTLEDGTYNRMSMMDLKKLVHIVLSRYEADVIAITSKNEIINSNSGLRMKNTNYSLMEKDSHIVGLKTGYTDVAGSCLVSIYEEGGAKFVNMTVGNPSKGAVLN